MQKQTIQFAISTIAPKERVRDTMLQDATLPPVAAALFNHNGSSWYEGGWPTAPQELKVRAEKQARGDTLHEYRIVSSAEDELVGIAHDWDRAMVENDVDAIAPYMADDWTIIGPDGRVGDKATFLRLVKSGDLTHDEMTSDDFHIRVYGETAVVCTRGVSGGSYRGQPFREVERSSNVFVRQAGQWRCVLTHLSRLAQTEVG